MCYGIQAYGDRREAAGRIAGEMAGKMEGTVRTLQRHGFSIADTIKDIMAEFHLKENDARDVVEKNWKKDLESKP